jgi:serine/threonine protein kinase
MGEELPDKKDNKESKYHLNHPLPVGTILAERFKIIKVLGKGSFGVVYQCNEEKTSKMYAIKAFKRKFQSWESAMRNAEVKAMIGLKHPNIVSCMEVLRIDECLLVVFELLDMDLYRMM